MFSSIFPSAFRPARLQNNETEKEKLIKKIDMLKKLIKDYDFSKLIIEEYIMLLENVRQLR
jgi:hypothetical protein